MQYLHLNEYERVWLISDKLLADTVGLLHLLIKLEDGREKLRLWTAKINVLQLKHFNQVIHDSNLKIIISNFHYPCQHVPFSIEYLVVQHKK